MIYINSCTWCYICIFTIYLIVSYITLLVICNTIVHNMYDDVYVLLNENITSITKIYLYNFIDYYMLLANTIRYILIIACTMLCLGATQSIWYYTKRLKANTKSSSNSKRHPQYAIYIGYDIV